MVFAVRALSREPRTHPEGVRMVSDREAMHLALDAARRGPASRNPQVGAVVLDATGRVLATGSHQGAGTAHAEIDALAKLDPDTARGATMVVTLEPCNHTGRTGPCSEALIAAGISRLVYGIPDPGAREGGGEERMRAAGIEVEGGVEAAAVGALLEPWLAATTLGRPRVTVKWAQSLDGRAAASDGSSRWITGPEARADVHHRRAMSDAIVVGTGTIIADDPSLTARAPKTLAEHQPVPVIVGERDIPPRARVLTHPRPVVHARSHDLHTVLSGLFDRGLHRVFVEGGPTLASAFIARGLVDELLIYTAPMLLGGPKTATDDLGVSSIDDARMLTVIEQTALGRDTLTVAVPARAHSAPREGIEQCSLV